MEMRGRERRKGRGERAGEKEDEGRRMGVRTGEIKGG